MKFLHSPTSSSSSSTSEIRPNYAISACFPTLLRRLLCFHSHPTLPFDHQVKESYQNNEFEEIYCDGEIKGNPGIVAKLMGLDSMPMRSSMNEWRELGLQRKGNYVYKYKAPSFVELENEKFIILSFEGGGKDTKLDLNSGSRKGFIELKKKTRNKNPETGGDVMNSCQLLGSKSDLDKNSMNLCCKRGKPSKKAEIESDSENSSPVSVLEFPDHQETSNPGKEDAKSKNSNSRRKLRDLDNNAPSPSPDSSESRRKCERMVGLMNNNFVFEDFEEMWEEMGKMAARDVLSSSELQRERWRKGEDYEEICVSFELQILDQLILELFTFT